MTIAPLRGLLAGAYHVGIVLASAAAVVSIAAGCASPAASSGQSPRVPPPVVSSATSAKAAGLVDVQAMVPRLQLDMRYAGSHNFVGRPIAGYDAPTCLLLRPVAEALRRVDDGLRADHRRLLAFDCYRPVRAVADFMRWARDLGDQAHKAEFYPDIDKTALVPQYIAARSGHSRGATLDLTLAQCDAADAECVPLDMGTAFDLFGEPAHTDSGMVSECQRANRHLLRDAMQAQGFDNYTDEWWHYTLKPEPTPQTAYDVPVR